MKPKIKFTIDIPKPRNPLVVPSMGLKAGSHEKPEKSIRAKMKVELKKNITSEFDK